MYAWAAGWRSAAPSRLQKCSSHLKQPSSPPNLVSTDTSQHWLLCRRPITFLGHTPALPRLPFHAHSPREPGWTRPTAAQICARFSTSYSTLVTGASWWLSRFHGDGSHAERTRGNPLRKLWNFHPLLCNTVTVTVYISVYISTSRLADKAALTQAFAEANFRHVLKKIY